MKEQPVVVIAEPSTKASHLAPSLRPALSPFRFKAISAFLDTL
jgi:hypothetical protein